MDMHVNLSNRKLTKLFSEQISADALSVDLSENELQTIDSTECLINVKELRLQHNRICRIICISRLSSLEILDLSHNRVSCLDGLNKLSKLKWLNLSYNTIQKFVYLDKLHLLTFLDLSLNGLVKIPNLSHLCALETVLLDGNKIVSLENASDCFPVSTLKVLGLSANQVSGCTQLSFLVGVTCLEQLNFSNNPCVSFTCTTVGFNYRPYLLCCCPNLKIIDGFVVSETEVLKGEWLFSLGKGRTFVPGQDKELSEYLASVCPLVEPLGSLTTEDELKLSRILAKRREYLSESVSASPPCSSLSKRTSTPLSANVHASQRFEFASGAREGDSDKENSGSDSQSTGVSKARTTTDRQAPDNVMTPSVNLSSSRTNKSSRNQYTEYEAQPAAAAMPSPFRSLTSDKQKFLRSPKPKNSQMHTLKNVSAQMHNYSGQCNLPSAETSFDDECSCASQISTSSYSQRRKWVPSKSPPFIKSKDETPSGSPRIVQTDANRIPATTAANNVQSKCDKAVATTSSAHNTALLVDQQELQHSATRKIQALWRGWYCRRHNADVQKIYAELRFQRIEARANLAIDELRKCQKQLAEEKQITNMLSELVRILYADIQELKQWKDRSSDKNNQSVSCTFEPLRPSSSTSTNLEYRISKDWSLSPPSSLVFTWKDDSSGILSWKPPPFVHNVQSYKIYFDNLLHGEVSGKHHRALLAELEPTVAYCVSVKSVIDGQESQMSSPLLISSFSQDSSSKASTKQCYETLNEQTDNDTVVASHSEVPATLNEANVQVENDVSDAMVSQVFTEGMFTSEAFDAYRQQTGCQQDATLQPDDTNSKEESSIDQGTNCS